MYLNNFTGCQSPTREQAQDEPPLTSRGNDNEPPDPAPVGLGHLLTEYAVLTPLSRKNPLNPPKQSPTHMTKAMEVILTYVFVLLSKGVLTIPWVPLPSSTPAPLFNYDEVSRHHILFLFPY